MASDDLNKFIEAEYEQKAGGEDAAFEFLQKHEDVWKNWVSEEAASKIKASL